MLRVGSSKKLDPTHNTSTNIFASNNHELTLMNLKSYLNDFLKFKSWDLASMLGLADFSGT